MALTNTPASRSFLKELWLIYSQTKVLALFCLGFSAGLPFLLIFSTLSLWLREAQVDRATIGFFSWVGLTFAFKWVWAPLIDRVSIPFLTRYLGRRRGWLIIAQIVIVLSIIGMANTDPGIDLFSMVCWALALAIGASTQDVVIDAYRIEAGDLSIQAALAAAYQSGYRIAMLVSGAGTIWIASWVSIDTHYSLYSWHIAYLVMAGLAGIGLITTLIVNEPDVLLKKNELEARAIDWMNKNQHLPDFLIKPIGFFYSLILCPFSDFFTRYGRQSLLILLLISVYKIADIVMGIMANPFYYDMGFTKDQIVTVVKFYGVIMTLLGAFFGGFLIHRFGIMKVLFLGAVLACVCNFFFALFAAYNEANVFWLTVIISTDNFSGGLASSAFIAWLSGLTNVYYSASQYAIFSSIMLLIPKFIAGFSGVAVDNFGYTLFFIGSGIIGIPVLWLIYLVGKSQQGTQLNH